MKVSHRIRFALIGYNNENLIKLNIKGKNSWPIMYLHIPTGKSRGWRAIKYNA